MKILQIRHAWPEKADYTIFRGAGRNDVTFLHFFNSVQIYIDGTTVETKPNACIFYTPHSKQSFHSSEPLMHDWMHLTVDSVSTINSFGIETNHLYYPSNSKFITDIFQELEAEFFNNKEYSEAFCDCKLKEFLIKFYRACNTKNDAPIIVAPTVDMFRSARRSFLLNIDENWTIEKMAALTNLSPSRFHVVYKSIFGTSPMNDLIHARIKAAKKNLLNTDLSITAISKNVGYENNTHFTRQFKKMTGLTPGEYRKKYKT